MRDFEKDYKKGEVAVKIIQTVAQESGWEFIYHNDNMVSQSAEVDATLRRDDQDISIEIKLDDHFHTGNLQFSYIKNSDNKRRWDSESDMMVILRYNLSKRDGSANIYFIDIQALKQMIKDYPSSYRLLSQPQHRKYYDHNQQFILVPLPTLVRHGVIYYDILVDENKLKDILKKVLI